MVLNEEYESEGTESVILDLPASQNRHQETWFTFDKVLGIPYTS